MDTDILAAPEELVTLGIDTAKDNHAVAVLDHRGGLLDTDAFPATPGGYEQLLDWASQYGVIDRVGIEGTGSYGAGLARWLAARGIVVVEVNRPDRADRRRRGKTDELDAENAARAVFSGKAKGLPKAGDGPVEAIRMLRITRRGAVKMRADTLNGLHGLVVTAPEPLKAKLGGLSPAKLVTAAARLRVPCEASPVLSCAVLALRSLARRVQQLAAEIRELDAQLGPLVAQTAPQLVARLGVGTDSAAALLIAAGDNPERLRTEACFAKLCGVAPLDASSGKQQRHRLNRGGNRDANRALHVIAITRMRFDPKTRDYIERRISEGKTKREAIRCLKRYIAREIYQLLVTPTHLKQAA